MFCTYIAPCTDDIIETQLWKLKKNVGIFQILFNFGMFYFYFCRLTAKQPLANTSQVRFHPWQPPSQTLSRLTPTKKLIKFNQGLRLWAQSASLFRANIISFYKLLFYDLKSNIEKIMHFISSFYKHYWLKMNFKNCYDFVSF